MRIDTHLCLIILICNMVDTKIMQYLDLHGIPYRILPHAEPVFTVEKAAARRGVVLEEMVKSILLRERRNYRYIMACVTGIAWLDPQAVREQLLGEWKRLSFATAEEIISITGCIKGAVAPLCLPEYVPIVFDGAISRCVKVNISSGDPMAGLELDASELIKISGATLAPIAAPKE